jgi:hypothetical protein
MNEFVTARGGWITSLPGDVTVRLACSPLSSLPDDLRRAGYDLTETGEGQRILFRRHYRAVRRRRRW